MTPTRVTPTRVTPTRMAQVRTESPHVSVGRMHEAELHADLSRVTAQLFVPGEEMGQTRSRAAQVVARVMEIAEADVEQIARQVVDDFAAHSGDLTALLMHHADVVSSRLNDDSELSEARKLVLGATFTAEFAVEGAALCNPSAVEHPDQSGLEAGQVRLAIGVRAIGEGHISSIGFAEAIVGPGREWRFDERQSPLARAALAEGQWSLAHFRRAVEHEGIIDEVASALIRALPWQFTATDLEVAIASLPHELTTRLDCHRQLDEVRQLVASIYLAHFDPDTALSQRVLMPVSVEEHHGMEDARFVVMTDADGATEYRATYTAYDGHHIAPRLITSPDLRQFAIQRLTGNAAHNKGMALFPRLVGGRHLSLSRTGGESISLASSPDGLNWNLLGTVHTPVQPWELIQSGNCGSPLETPQGWLVLTHGVGPMRTYSLGALLLDLDDPTIVLSRTTTPLLSPGAEWHSGYVPNVVYSCGGIIVDGVLWVPVGIGDVRIGVFSVEVDELLASMTPGATETSALASLD